jgi:hypothetical protein
MTVLPCEKYGEKRIFRRALELKFKSKRATKQPRTRWFRNVVKDIKRGKSWQETERKKSGEKDAFHPFPHTNWKLCWMKNAPFQGTNWQSLYPVLSINIIV